MDVTTRKVAELSTDPANARIHPQRNVDAIVASLRRFGQQKPIVVDKSNVVRAGNGTLEAARILGWDTIQCVHTALESTEATAYSIADNRTAELAEWDDAVLAATLESLDADGALADVGFDEKELQQLLATVNQGEIVEDEVPEPPENPITKTGDLWVMGEHRLLCGDSTNAEDVGRLLNGSTPFIMVTDPPYGVEYDPEWREAIDGINRSKGKVSNDHEVDWTPAYKLFPGDVAYIWHAGRFAADLVVNLRDADFEIRTQIVWRKEQIVFGRGHYHWQHEPCWYAVRKGGSAKWCGDRSQSTIWDIHKLHPNRGAEGRQTTHGTEKPVECMARPIRNHGGKDDDAYDPFLGSGTTLIAAEQLSRRCFAMEISPQYCDVAVKRWETLTGRKAVLE